MVISLLHSPSSSFQQSPILDYESDMLAIGILAGNVAHVEALVRLEATVSVRHHWTLYQACLVGSDIVQALLLSPQISSALYDPAESGDAIVHWVLRTSSSRFSTLKQQVVELLSKHSARFFEPDKLRETYLYILAAIPEEEEAEILRVILLERGRTPCLNHRNHSSDTALIIAIIYNHLEAAKLLLNLGADPNIKGEGGLPAIYHAIYQSNLEMLALLQ